MFTDINFVEIGRELVRILREQPDSDLAQEIKRQIEQSQRRTSEEAPLVKLEIIEGTNRISFNPLLAWEAFHHCRINKIAIPEWVLIYLDNTADKLLSIQPAKGVQWDIVNACGLNTTGQGNSFTRYQKTKIKIDAVIKVIKRIYETKEDVLTACAVIANEMEQEHNIFFEGRTISNWYYELREALTTPLA
jgi:hypothetical protein